MKKQLLICTLLSLCVSITTIAQVKLENGIIFKANKGYLLEMTIGSDLKNFYALTKKGRDNDYELTKFDNTNLNQIGNYPLKFKDETNKPINPEVNRCFIAGEQLVFLSNVWGKKDVSYYLSAFSNQGNFIKTTKVATVPMNGDAAYYYFELRYNTNKSKIAILSTIDSTGQENLGIAIKFGERSASEKLMLYNTSDLSKVLEKQLPSRLNGEKSKVVEYEFTNEDDIVYQISVPGAASNSFSNGFDKFNSLDYRVISAIGCVSATNNEISIANLKLDAGIYAHAGKIKKVAGQYVYAGVFKENIQKTLSKIGVFYSTLSLTDHKLNEIKIVDKSFLPDSLQQKLKYTELYDKNPASKSYFVNDIIENNGSLYLLAEHKSRQSGGIQLYYVQEILVTKFENSKAQWTRLIPRTNIIAANLKVEYESEYFAFGKATGGLNIVFRTAEKNLTKPNFINLCANDIKSSGNAIVVLDIDKDNKAVLFQLNKKDASYIGSMSVINIADKNYCPLILWSGETEAKADKLIFK